MLKCLWGECGERLGPECRLASERGFEDREGARDGYVVGHQKLIRASASRAVRCHPGERGAAGLTRANVGLLVRIELCVDEETMLKVVDPEFRGFRIGNGAQVPGHLEVQLVRCVIAAASSARVMCI